MKKFIFIISSLILLLIGLMLGSKNSLLIPVYAQTVATTVTAQPRVTTVVLGNQVIVDINVTNGDHLASFDFKLQYNPSVLTIANAATDVVIGSYLNPNAYVAYRSVNNTTGFVQFAAYSDAGLNNGKSGNGTLATITFTTIGAGTSALTLSNVLLVHDDLDATLQPNTTVNGSVTVTSNVSPTPTPRPSPSSTPTPRPSPTPTTQPNPTPSTSPATVILQLKFEGVNVQRSADQLVTITTEQGTTVINTKTVRFRNDAGGVYSNDIGDPNNYINLNPGTYDFLVNGPVHLTHRFLANVISSGINTVNLTSFVLINGDIVDNNSIDSGDYSKIVENFGCTVSGTTPPGKICPPTGVQIPSDLDLDGDVDIFDYAYLVGNYSKTGDQP